MIIYAGFDDINNGMNKNTTSSNNFQMFIGRCPNVTFNLTTIPIPTISIGPTIVPTREGDYPIPSTKPTFDPLNVEFIIDETYENYSELLGWINEMRAGGKDGNISSLVSDIQIVILSNSKNPVRVFNFRDAFPTILNEISLSYGDDDSTIPITSATFNYSYFETEAI